MSCEKHPNHVRNASPEELAQEVEDSVYSYQKRFYNELWKRYLKRSEEDKERPSLKNPNENRTQLASELEKLAKAIKGPVSRPIKKICEICKSYMKTNNSSQ